MEQALSTGGADTLVDSKIRGDSGPISKGESGGVNSRTCAPVIWKYDGGSTALPAIIWELPETIGSIL